MSYRLLNAEKIVATLEALENRINERFPRSSLAGVCSELVAISRETHNRVIEIERPNIPLRVASAAIAAFGVALLIYFATIIEYKREMENLFGILEGFDALLNTVVLMGAGMFFLATLESRWKRQRALDDLHHLRSIVHVIDMHQLTKDPRSLTAAQRTKSSPVRKLSDFELTRYLDYCTEMLSLTAKVAALYAQSARDAAVLGAVSELETVSSNLSGKIWQKIMIIQSDENARDILESVEQATPTRPPRIVARGTAGAPAPERAGEDELAG